MFEKLIIRNIQSHKRTVLEFSSGVNIITGPTDSGKSAILRALRWIIWNQPSGDSLRSNWGGESSVTLIDSDKNIIKRIDGKERLYILNDSEFRAFRTDVPAEIQQVLNMTEVNMQEQFDSIFLFSQSPGKVAKHFNKIANLEKIASSQKNIKKWMSSLNSSITYAQSQLKKNQEQLSDYEDLDKYEINIEVLEDLDKQIQQYSSQIDKVNDLIEQLDNLDKGIKEELRISSLKPLIEEAIKVKGQIIAISENIDLLQDLLSDIKKCDKEIEEKSKELKVNDEIEEAIVYLNQIHILKGKIESIQSIISLIEKANNRLKYYKEEELRLKEIFELEMGDTCLLCGQSIIHTHKK